MVEISALIELLLEKGIITEGEMMEKCKNLRGRFGEGRCLFHPGFVSFVAGCRMASPVRNRSL